MTRLHDYITWIGTYVYVCMYVIEGQGVRQTTKRQWCIGHSVYGATLRLQLWSYEVYTFFVMALDAARTCYIGLFACERSRRPSSHGHTQCPIRNAMMEYVYMYRQSMAGQR